MVKTASHLLIVALSGMRQSELREMHAGCRVPPTEVGPGLKRYKLASRVVKGKHPGETHLPQRHVPGGMGRQRAEVEADAAGDAAGADLGGRGLGGVADDWVVVREAHQATEVAEALLGPGAKPGDPLLSSPLDRTRYTTFRRWVNSAAGQALGLAPIPGTRHARMLRRTLALEIAYRPSGLLAAKVQLKHLSVVTTEGDANRPGGAQAKFLAEVNAGETERNKDLILADYRRYQAGQLPSGPGARDLIAFFTGVDGRLARASTHPNVLGSDQEIRALLSERAEVLHLGVANYCWFTDPSKALCLKLAGTGCDEASGRPVRLRALPAGHPPLMPSPRLGREREGQAGLHRIDRPQPQDGEGPPDGRPGAGHENPGLHRCRRVRRNPPHGPHQRTDPRPQRGRYPGRDGPAPEGDLPPGRGCDVKTLAAEAGVTRTAFYPKKNRDGTTHPGPYQHLAEEFERRLRALQAAGHVTDPRIEQIERRKAQVAGLKERLAKRDETVAELTAFKSLAVSRLAAPA
ncbi:hypothetical protein [Nocardia thailandica]